MSDEMTFMQLEGVKLRASRELENVQNELDEAVQRFGTIITNLNTLANRYGAAGGWADQVDAFSATNPGNPAVDALKAYKDQMLVEFGSTSAKAMAMQTAVNGVG